VFPVPLADSLEDGLSYSLKNKSIQEVRKQNMPSSDAWCS
jgi:hypothetical protein